MEEQKESFLLKNISAIITILGLIITGLFWIFTMNGIPKRVTHLENELQKIELDVNTLNQNVNTNDVKINIMLDDIKFIKQVITQKDMK